MGFVDALTTVFRNKYVTFSGRASRSEYWWSYLGYSVIAMVAWIVAFVVVLAVPDLAAVLLVPMLVALAMIIPMLSVSVRRLHDTGKSGWMILIMMIPCIGIILWIVWMVEDGQAHDNTYGPVPTNTLE